MHTIEYFINKFYHIPEEAWCTRALQNDEGQRCARGHLLLGSDTMQGTWEDKYLRIMIPKLAQINNGQDDRYQQATPKQRVLASLYDYQRKIQSEITDPPIYVEDIVGELQLAQS